MYGDYGSFGNLSRFPLESQDMYTVKPDWKKDFWDKFFDACIIVLGVPIIGLIVLWAIFVGGE